MSCNRAKHCINEIEELGNIKLQTFDGVVVVKY